MCENQTTTVVLFVHSDYDDDDNYDYIGTTHGGNENQYLSTSTTGVVENPYYEDSTNDKLGNQGPVQETETITVTRNLYYE